jgi:hypothetical protein
MIGSLPARRWISSTLLFVITAALSAQQTAPDTTSRATLKVYVDCEDWQGCDFDYFRTEMTFVNWVRDRQVADVHILVTTQHTGAGGREYTVTFLGLRTFAGLSDTLKYVAPPAATQDDRRRGLAAVFRAGLVRYLARTPDLARLTIRVGDTTGAAAPAAAPQHDRWNAWVFNTNVNGFTNGEKTYHSFESWSSVNADRVTQQWKTHFSLENSYDQSDFDIDSVTTFTTIQRRYGANALQVKSLGEHWSAGARASVSSSTYDNYRRVIRFTPAVEYDVFPYSRSTRRQLRLEYNVGMADYAYNDTTIFDRTHETMPVHNLSVSLATRETWGSIDLGVNANGYLNDRAKYRLGSFTQLSLRLFRGFSLRAFGSYTVIRDQFALAKKDFTPEQILTRQFQRATTYRYFGNLGLGYTFGSIFNNVVNPRMASDFFD